MLHAVHACHFFCTFGKSGIQKRSGKSWDDFSCEGNCIFVFLIFTAIINAIIFPSLSFYTTKV